MLQAIAEYAYFIISASHPIFPTIPNSPNCASQNPLPTSLPLPFFLSALVYPVAYKYLNTSQAAPGRRRNWVTETGNQQSRKSSNIVFQEIVVSTLSAVEQVHGALLLLVGAGGHFFGAGVGVGIGDSSGLSEGAYAHGLPG